MLQLASESLWKMPQKTREEILQRDGGCCWYCGEPGHTVDHWIPLCRGGTNSKLNLVCACKACNDLKGNLMPDNFMALLEPVSPPVW